MKALSGFLVSFVFGFVFFQVMTDLYQLYYNFSLFGRGEVRALVLKKEEKVVGGMGKPLPAIDSCVHPFLSGICAKLQEENCPEIQRSVEVLIQFNMISLWDWSCSPKFTEETKGEEKKPLSAFRRHDWLAVFNSNHSSV